MLLPIRIELWGDTVDTLSYFDLLTQRRTDAIAAADIPPAAEILYDDAEALAGRIEALVAPLRGKTAAIQRETLLADARPAAGRRMSRLAGQIHPPDLPPACHRAGLRRGFPAAGIGGRQGTGTAAHRPMAAPGGHQDPARGGTALPRPFGLYAGLVRTGHPTRTAGHRLSRGLCPLQPGYKNTLFV